MDTIESLRAENSRLRSLIESQREAIRGLTNEVKSHEAKEQSISSAIVFAVERSSQWDNSMHKLYELNIQRLRLLYARMEKVLNDLYAKYPGLKKEQKLKEMTDKLKSEAYNSSVQIDLEHSTPARTEDPIKKLLNNIINYIDDTKETITLPRRPGAKSTIDTLRSDYATTPSKSGFDINEALNPSEDLEDILKSFNLKRKTK